MTIIERTQTTDYIAKTYSDVILFDTELESQRESTVRMLLERLEDASVQDLFPSQEDSDCLEDIIEAFTEALEFHRRNHWQAVAAKRKANRS